MASPTPLAGVHWIRATIPTIYDDLHQAFVVAEGAATGHHHRCWIHRSSPRVSVGAQAGARWRRTGAGAGEARVRGDGAVARRWGRTGLEEQEAWRWGWGRGRGSKGAGVQE